MHGSTSLFQPRYQKPGARWVVMRLALQRPMRQPSRSPVLRRGRSRPVPWYCSTPCRRHLTAPPTEAQAATDHALGGDNERSIFENLFYHVTHGVSCAHATLAPTRRPRCWLATAPTAACMAHQAPHLWCSSISWSMKEAPRDAISPARGYQRHHFDQLPHVTHGYPRKGAINNNSTLRSTQSWVYELGDAVIYV